MTIGMNSAAWEMLAASCRETLGLYKPPAWPDSSVGEQGYAGIAADYWDELGEWYVADTLRRAGQWLEYSQPRSQ